MKLTVDGVDLDLVREEDITKLALILAKAERCSTLLFWMKLAYRERHSGKQKSKWLGEIAAQMASK